MKLVISTLAVLVFAGLTLAQSISGSSFLDGKKYSYEIDEKALEKTSSWDPEREPPRMSVQEVISAARVGLKRLVPKSDDRWQVYGVELHRIGERERKWIYEVKFVCYLDKCSASDTFDVWVKLDGTVLEPSISDDSEPPNVKKGQIKVGGTIAKPL
jgi:hypothetical protein